MGLRRFFYTTYTHHPHGLPRSSVAHCFSNQTPRHQEWIHSDRCDAAGSLPSTLKMAGTCLGTTAAPLCTMHIYVLIALQPARSINVLLFQLPEWQKYEMLPVSSGVYLFVRHTNDVGCHAAHQETWINQKPCHYFHGIDVTKHFERQSFGHRVIFSIYSFISQPGLWVHDLVSHKRGRHWSGLHVLHLPRLSDLKMWTRRMESNVPKASWQEMSRRDMHLQRPSHRQGFVGRFLHCSGSSLSGLAVSSCASNSKTPEEENQVIQSIQRLTPLLHGEQFPSFVWGFV